MPCFGRQVTVNDAGPELAVRVIHRECLGPEEQRLVHVDGDRLLDLVGPDSCLKGEIRAPALDRIAVELVLDRSVAVVPRAERDPATRLVPRDSVAGYECQSGRGDQSRFDFSLTEQSQGGHMALLHHANLQ